jgi:hypothetical protein
MCKEGSLEIRKYFLPKNALGRTKGILVCDKCGHKESFL